MYWKTKRTMGNLNKSLNTQQKTLISNFIAFESKNTLTFKKKTIAELY